MRQLSQLKVEKEHAIHGFQAEFPIHSPLSLTGYGLRQVIDGALAEVHVFPILHFHDKLFAVLIRAIDVVDETAIFLIYRY